VAFALAACGVLCGVVWSALSPAARSERRPRR
jgi:cbb3-type cytochrome oxidase subunit 3